MTESSFSTSSKPRDLAALTVADFHPHLDQEFQITDDQNGLSLRGVLERVESINTPNWPAEFRTPFALGFKVEGSNPIGQGTYLVQNEQFGSAPLFLVPSGSDEQYTYLEATFT